MIADHLGEVLEVDVDRMLCGSRHVRVQIKIDVFKPLCRHIYILNGKKEQVKVELQYEKLPNFCYWCGLLGHTERECLVKPIDTSNKIVDWPIKETLRASLLKPRSRRYNTTSGFQNDVSRYVSEITIYEASKKQLNGAQDKVDNTPEYVS